MVPVAVLSKRQHQSGAGFTARPVCVFFVCPPRQKNQVPHHGPSHISLKTKISGRAVKPIQEKLYTPTLTKYSTWPTSSVCLIHLFLRESLYSCFLASRGTTVPSFSDALAFQIRRLVSSLPVMTNLRITFPKGRWKRQRHVGGVGITLHAVSKQLLEYTVVIKL